MKELLKKLLETNYKNKRKSKIIFVLSTGRCGSTSITEMFNQYPDFLAFHEKISELIFLSTSLAENPSSKSKIHQCLKTIFQEKKWEAKKDQVIVHSDHRLWNLVDFLSEYFPNSYFIHLMRNPYDSVKSYVPRKWYTEYDCKFIDENPHAKYRLQANRIGVISDQKWVKMDQMEKCMWYWNYVNISIQHQLQKVENKRCFSIQLEDMENQLNKKINENFNFKKDFHFKNSVSNRSKTTIEIEENFNSKFLKALKEYGSEFTEMFYPSYLKEN